MSPANIKDTAILTYDYPEADRDDDQWLYLPAVRKVRRISASDRGDYVLGTDFTYEDIRKETKVGIEDYSWKTLAEETIDGHRCFLVGEIPVNEQTAKELGYSKMQSWVDAEIWMVRQAKYWDVAGNPLKTLLVREITLIRDIWTAHQISVENHKTGHKTVFTFKDVNYGQSVKDELFTEDGLPSYFHLRGVPPRASLAGDTRLTQHLTSVNPCGPEESRAFHGHCHKICQPCHT